MYGVTKKENGISYYSLTLHDLDGIVLEQFSVSVYYKKLERNNTQREKYEKVQADDLINFAYSEVNQSSKI